MTIHTRFSIVGHVGIATRIDEGVCPNTYSHADRDPKNNPAGKFGSSFALSCRYFFG